MKTKIFIIIYLILIIQVSRCMFLNIALYNYSHILILKQKISRENSDSKTGKNHGFSHAMYSP